MNTCNGCTMCCLILPVPWMDKKAGEWCKKCKPGIGCSIYDNAPEDCIKYKCAYLQMEEVDIRLRPDHCKIIFEKLNDSIFHGSQHPDYELTKDALGQIRSFMREGFSVVVETLNKKPKIFPAKGVKAMEVYNSFMQEVEKRNGSAIVHN